MSSSVEAPCARCSCQAGCSPTRERAASTVRVAMVGNPGSGKTTVFGALARCRRCKAPISEDLEPGRTGVFELDGTRFEVVDLPGVYGLTSDNIDEALVRNVLLKGWADVVVDVLDASNLERNLYLTTQLLELGVNLVLCLNMSDAARRAGWSIDPQRLGDKLGKVEVISTEGGRRPGIAELRAAIARAARSPARPLEITYPEPLEEETSRLATELGELLPDVAARRFLAVHLFEDPHSFGGRLRIDHPQIGPLLERVAEDSQQLGEELGESPLVLLAERRWQLAAELVQDVATQKPSPDQVSLTDRIDRVLTHRWLGFPLYLAIIYLIFWLTFRIGEQPTRWIEAGIRWLSGRLEAQWPAGKLPWLQSLLVDGVLGGVGGVLVFLPYIVLLFFCLAVLSSTGYMARAAFLNDRLLRKIGLHGRAFIPMVVGFGCTVPAVMACRILESERDRLTTMMILPLMSCGSRLPIYLLLIPAFFEPQWWAPLMMGVYMLGMVVAALLALLLRRTLLSGEDSPFVMELPSYRLPRPRNLVRQTLRPAWLYLQKVGTVILGLSIILWALTSIPVDQATVSAVGAGESAAAVDAVDPETARAAQRLYGSAAGHIGRAIEPVLAPMGFDWRLGTAFLGALAAKEMFVAQMGIIFSLGDAGHGKTGSLREQLAESYSPWVGLAVVIFALVASPCMATLAVVRRESRSWRWPLLQWFGLTVLAYVLATIVNQLGRLLTPVA